jgi:cysteine desulfurase
MTTHRVYLDNNAATLPDPRVVEAYQYALKTCWANPGSSHREGQHAKGLLEEARARIARRFDVSPRQIIFFSSATEGLNTFLRGFIDRSSRGRIVTTNVEHAAVWQCCRRLETEGCDVTFLSVGPQGAPSPEAVEKALSGPVSALALMSVNNETGVVTDIEACAAIARERKIPFLVDAVAQLGKLPFVLLPGISAACFSAYKIHAPCGTGFAVVQPNVPFLPLIEGGGQEFGKRSGTENVPSIYACSVALDLIVSEMEESSKKMRELRDIFERKVFASISGVQINGEGPRVCNTSNLAFDGIQGEELLIQLDLFGVAASHGAACSSGALTPSRVLLEMGYSQKRAASSVRFSLGKFTTEDEIDEAVRMICKAVEKQRA